MDMTQIEDILKWAGKPDEETCDAWDAHDRKVAKRIAENERLRAAFEDVEQWCGSWPMSVEAYDRRIGHLLAAINGDG